MPIDLDAAARFVFANARVLERRRLAALLHDAPVTPIVDALRAYRNDDGGFGHALEPDVRAPDSEPASVAHALDVLAACEGEGADLVRGAAAWIERIAHDDGGVPFVLETAAAYPHAPWMVPSDGGSFLTFALVARLHELGHESAWRERATDWCWRRLEDPGALGAYWVKFALRFLDTFPEDARTAEVLEAVRGRLHADGTLPVEGGIDDERLTALDLSPRPGRASRGLLDAHAVERELDALEAEQQPDGGWTFDWLAWSPGQEVEWRGIVTVHALETLRAHGRAGA